MVGVQSIYKSHNIIKEWGVLHNKNFRVFFSAITFPYFNYLSITFVKNTIDRLPSFLKQNIMIIMYCFPDELGNFIHTTYCTLTSFNEALDGY